MEFILFRLQATCAICYHRLSLVPVPVLEKLNTYLDYSPSTYIPWIALNSPVWNGLEFLANLELLNFNLRGYSQFDRGVGSKSSDHCVKSLRTLKGKMVLNQRYSVKDFVYLGSSCMSFDATSHMIKSR